MSSWVQILLIGIYLVGFVIAFAWVLSEFIKDCRTKVIKWKARPKRSLAIKEPDPRDGSWWAWALLVSISLAAVWPLLLVMLAVHLAMSAVSWPFKTALTYLVNRKLTEPDQ
ncbi:MAG: hypothetical protein AAF583_01540 [Pseudomonadota bacterium]